MASRLPGPSVSMRRTTPRASTRPVNMDLLENLATVRKGDRTPHIARTPLLFRAHSRVLSPFRTVSWIWLASRAALDGPWFLDCRRGQRRSGAARTARPQVENRKTKRIQPKDRNQHELANQHE